MDGCASGIRSWPAFVVVVYPRVLAARTRARV